MIEAIVGIAVAVAALGLIGGLLNRRRELRRRFNNVYAMTTPDRRRSIIEFYRKRDGGSRWRAMATAVSENTRDRGRW
jgi:hypothetical protein